MERKTPTAPKRVIQREKPNEKKRAINCKTPISVKRAMIAKSPTPGKRANGPKTPSKRKASHSLEDTHAPEAPAKSPKEITMTPEELKAARIAAGMTPMQAAVLVHVDKRTWQRYESGTSQIPGAIVELFQIKTRESQ